MGALLRRASTEPALATRAMPFSRSSHLLQALGLIAVQGTSAAWFEHDGLSAAIMDHALSDGDSSELCARLKARGIPHVSYSRYSRVKGASEMHRI